MKILCYTQNWGFPRGVCYYARSQIKALLSLGHEVTVLCYGGLDRGDVEFDLPIKKIYTNDFWQISKEFFKSILDEVKPDYCFFYEYDQWVENKDNLIEVCWENNVKPIAAWIAWEKLFNYMVPKFKRFHKIFVPTKGQTKIFRSFGLINSYYIPFGLDLEEFKGKHKEISDKVVFLHNKGYDTNVDRKNTKVVIEAYELMKDKNTRLIVNSQRINELSYSDIKDLYKQVDCFVFPSRFEGYGVPLVESIISGTPVISTKYLPMSEIVEENKTGLLVEAYDFKQNDKIGVAQQLIEPFDLAEKMKMIKQKHIREILSKGCQESKDRFDYLKMAEAMEKELK